MSRVKRNSPLLYRLLIRLRVSCSFHPCALLLCRPHHPRSAAAVQSERREQPGGGGRRRPRRHEAARHAQPKMRPHPLFSRSARGKTRGGARTSRWIGKLGGTSMAANPILIRSDRFLSLGSTCLNCCAAAAAVQATARRTPRACLRSTTTAPLTADGVSHSAHAE